MFICSIVLCYTSHFYKKISPSPPQKKKKLINFFINKKIKKKGYIQK